MLRSPSEQNRRDFLKFTAGTSAALWFPRWVAAEDDAAKVAKRTESSDQKPTVGAALKLARDTQEALKKIGDYDANFSKKEVVGNKLLSTDMYIKFRGQPFSVYMKYINPHPGREVIFVAGQNKDRILAHAGGVAAIVGTLKLKVDSKDAMEESRYPITMFGMHTLIAEIIKQWEADEKHGEAVVKFFPNAKVDKIECKVAETSYLKPAAHAKSHITRLYISKETSLPVRVEHLGFPAKDGAQPPILEEYTYSNVRTNIGLGDQDFDKDNKAYGF